MATAGAVSGEIVNKITTQLQCNSNVLDMSPTVLREGIDIIL